MNNNKPNQAYTDNDAFIGTGLTLAFRSENYSNGWRNVYAPSADAVAWDRPDLVGTDNLFAIESNNFPGCFSYAVITPVASKQTKVLGSKACYAPRGYRVRVEFVNPDVAEVLGAGFEGWLLDELDPASR